VAAEALVVSTGTSILDYHRGDKVSISESTICIELVALEDLVRERLAEPASDEHPSSPICTTCHHSDWWQPPGGGLACNICHPNPATLVGRASCSPSGEHSTLQCERGPH
jgi:hypothetical protein